MITCLILPIFLTCIILMKTNSFNLVRLRFRNSSYEHNLLIVSLASLQTVSRHVCLWGWTLIEKEWNSFFLMSQLTPVSKHKWLHWADQQWCIQKRSAYSESQTISFFLSYYYALKTDFYNQAWFNIFQPLTLNGPPTESLLM